MATRRLSGMTTSSSVPDNGGDHSGGGGDGGTFIDDVFSTYLYTGTGADQTIRNGIELGGGTLLAGSWCFQGTWEADKVIGSFSGAKTGDYIVGISVGLETVGPAEIKANGVVVPITSTGKDPQGYHDSVHLMQVDADGDIDITSSVNMWAANFVLIRGASEIVPKTALTVGTFTSIQDPSYSSDGSGLFLLSDRSPYSANFGDLNKYSSEAKTFSTYIGGISGDGSSVAEVNVTGLAPSYANCYATFEMKGMPDATPTQLQGGEGGMVWIKARTTAGGGNIEGNHALFDTERGTGSGLKSNTSDPAGTHSHSDNTLESYNSNGFSIGASSAVNAGGADYASWTWRKQPKFFDCVTYTGDQEVGREIPHNLGSVPGMMIIKRTDQDRGWVVYHQSIGNDNSLVLDRDIKAYSSALFNYTTPTDKVFSINDDYNVNAMFGKYVAYLFAHDDSDEGLIQCGEMLTNASGVGEIDLGWEPQWVLYKETDRSGPWRMMDTMRGMPNNGTSYTTPTTLMAHESSAEAAYDVAWATATGFYLHNGVADGKYIYMAIRRPNKPAEEFEPEELFALAGNTHTTSDPAFVSGFPVDMGLSDGPDVGWDKDIATRLTGTKRQETNKDAAEGNQPAYKWDYMNGFMSGNNGSTYGWQWRRQPGFFDVVCYTGDGQDGRGIPHNLGVEPEMIWSKCRSLTQDWYVHVKGVTAKDNHLQLNHDKKIVNGTAFHEGHNEDQFFVQGSQTNWANQSHITYLFASVPGICDIGTYTGNGSLVGVDCGFTNGARFVLIKRTDSTGDWMVFDTIRGITNSDSPMIALNNNNAQVNGPYIRSWPQGFRAGNSGLETAASIDGAEYIYMAIA